MDRLFASFLVILIVSISQSFASPSVFRILLTNGQVLYQEENSNSISNLEIKQSIGYGTIRLKTQGCFSMIHASGNVVELTDSGTYSVKELETKILNKKPCPKTKQIAQLFFDQKSKTPTSSIRCGGPDINLHETSLNRRATLTNKPTKISWNVYYNNSKQFTLTLTSNIFDTLIKIDIKEPGYILNPSALSKYNQKLLIFSISEGQHENSILLNVKSDSLSNKYFNELATLQKEFSDRSSPSLLLLSGVIADKHDLAIDEHNFYDELFERIRVLRNLPNRYIGFDQLRTLLNYAIY